MRTLVPTLLLASFALAGCTQAAGTELPEPPAPTTPDPAPTTPDAAPTTAAPTTPDPEPTTAAPTTPDPVHATLEVEPVVEPEPPRTVALTFDDGPGPQTPEILEALVDADATATFFVVGAHVPGREQAVADLVDAGMSVQWHTHRHPDLTRLSDAAVAAEMSVPRGLSSTGFDPSCVRPPYGATDARVSRLVAAAGFEQVLWTVDPMDWAATDPDRLVDDVMAGLTDGATVLLHDGGGDRSVTVEALPQLLDRLAEEGWTTVPLCLDE